MDPPVTPDIPRPQPIGIHPPPAGYLLLPPHSEADKFIPRLLRGDIDVDWRSEWRFFELAVRGDLEAAWCKLQDVPGPCAAFNRFVMRPAREALETFRREHGGMWGELAQAVGYALGVADTLPVLDGLDGELRAFAGAAWTAQALEVGDLPRAFAALDEAITEASGASPLFAAQLLLQRAELWGQVQPPRGDLAVADLRRALGLSADAPLERLRAELWLSLGDLLHEAADGRREPLVEAIQAYQACLRSGVSADRHADLFARAQHHLALAYLAMPRTGAADHLSQGIAVQSLRAALRVYDRERHPQLWSSVQLNLANALQYLPSSHPEENMIQAVEIYEELLAARDRALDPLGYARLLADQANALAHLGLFPPALEKLDEAHKLFHWHGEPESARSVMELVDTIHNRRASGAPDATASPAMSE